MFQKANVKSISFNVISPNDVKHRKSSELNELIVKRRHWKASAEHISVYKEI